MHPSSAPHNRFCGLLRFHVILGPDKDRQLSDIRGKTVETPAFISILASSHKIALRGWKEVEIVTEVYYAIFDILAYAMLNGYIAARHGTGL